MPATTGMPRSGGSQVNGAAMVTTRVSRSSLGETLWSIRRECSYVCVVWRMLVSGSEQYRAPDEPILSGYRMRISRAALMRYSLALTSFSMRGMQAAWLIFVIPVASIAFSITAICVLSTPWRWLWLAVTVIAIIVLAIPIRGVIATYASVSRWQIPGDTQQTRIYSDRIAFRNDDWVVDYLFCDFTEMQLRFGMIVMSGPKLTAPILLPEKLFPAESRTLVQDRLPVMKTRASRRDGHLAI